MDMPLLQKVQLPELCSYLLTSAGKSRRPFNSLISPSEAGAVWPLCRCEIRSSHDVQRNYDAEISLTGLFHNILKEKLSAECLQPIAKCIINEIRVRGTFLCSSFIR